MSETYPGQMLPELQEKTTVDSNDLFYMVSSNASKKIKGSNLKAQMKPSDYTGATSSVNGANGLVPQPTTSDVDRFLKGDGTWGDISYAVGEVSGSIATFSDGSALPMRSLKAHIEPVQDLHGYDAPWVGGSGKNKAQPVITTNTTLGGIAFNPIKDNDGNVLGLSVGNGTVNADINQHIAEFSCSESGTYKIIGAKLNGSLSVNKRILLWDNTSQTTIVTIIDNNEVSVRLTAGHEYSLAINIRNSVTVDASELRFMICKDSESSTFAPYSNICPISGWGECKVTRCGENLFDKATITENKILNNTTGEETTSYGRFASDYIKVNPSTDYYASNVIKSAQWYCVFYYDKNKNYLSCGGLSSTGDTASGVVTTPSGCNYARLVGVTTYKDDVSFVVGNQPPTTYEPYNGTTYTIQFTDGSNPLTVYGGYVDIVSGLLVVDRKLIDVSSMASSVGYNSGVGAGTLANTGLKANITSETLNEYISNCLKAHINSNVASMNYEFTIDANSGLLFKIPNCTSASDYQTWLGSNNLHIVGALATPITIQLTPTQVKSLLGENNVWADTGDVDVHYVRDLTITIDDILSRLEALEG